MKKHLFLISILFLSLTSIHSMGIGPQMQITPGFSKEDAVFNAGLSCSIKMDNIPLIMNVCNNWDFCTSSFDSYVALDYWLLNPQLSDYAHFFFGIGGQAGITVLTDVSVDLAPRAFLGFNWIYYDGFLEPFVQLSVVPLSNFYLDGNYTFKAEFPVSAGIRMYF